MCTYTCTSMGPNMFVCPCHLCVNVEPSRSKETIPVYEKLITEADTCPWMHIQTMHKIQIYKIEDTKKCSK